MQAKLCAPPAYTTIFRQILCRRPTARVLLPGSITDGGPMDRGARKPERTVRRERTFRSAKRTAERVGPIPSAPRTLTLVPVPSGFLTRARRPNREAAPVRRPSKKRALRMPKACSERTAKVKSRGRLAAYARFLRQRKLSSLYTPPELSVRSKRSQPQEKKAARSLLRNRPANTRAPDREIILLSRD
jgi:hypothetical protein